MQTMFTKLDFFLRENTVEHQILNTEVSAYKTALG